MKTLVTRLIYLIMFMLLAACGGGSSGGSPSSIDNPPPTNSSSSSIKLAKTVLQMNETTTVTAKFVDSSGNPAAGVTTTFSTSIGTLNPANGQVVTDATGTATAQLVLGSITGTGIVTANAVVAGRQVSKSASFSVNLPPLKLSSPTLGLSNLSYAGSTSVSVSILDANGALYTAQDVDVTFTSTQVVAGKATLPQTVRSVNGVASATYKANTVVGSDTITIALGDSVVQTSLTVNPADASSIQYVSAVPANIGLKGMGGAGITETSTVTFRVLDVYGQPRANQQVSFKLNTEVGGLRLVATSGSTASDGTVSTIVQAGTIATPVRVTATLVGVTPVISTQSDQLVVSTGVPAQDGLSISLSKLNTESFSYDGVESTVTARLSDHFHNPVPNGTAVYFTTSGGAIQPSCTTIDGACSVTWRSQNPRPANGRAVILAYALGEEAFLDSNGNGYADGSCADMGNGTNLATSRSCGEFTDISEAFRDDNEDLKRNISETFIDFNLDGIFNGPDGKYNGVLQGVESAGATKSKHVFSNVVHVMGASGIGSFTPSTTTLDPGTSLLKSSKIVSFNIKDTNGNAMPGGTTVNANRLSYNGPLDWSPTLVGSETFVIVDSTSTTGTNLVLTIENSSSYTSSSSIIFKVTTPNGNTTDIPVTFSWTGLSLSVSPIAVAFSTTDKLGTNKTVNISGGKPPFTVTSNKPDIDATIALSVSQYIVNVTLTRDAPVGGAAQNATVTVKDANNVEKTVSVSYY